MNIAIVRLYAATTHWIPVSPAPNSRWMSGIATFTIIASRKIMNRPRPVATSVHVPRRVAGPEFIGARLRGPRARAVDSAGQRRLRAEPPSRRHRPISCLLHLEPYGLGISCMDRYPLRFVRRARTRTRTTVVIAVVAIGLVSFSAAGATGYLFPLESGDSIGIGCNGTYLSRERVSPTVSELTCTGP